LFCGRHQLVYGEHNIGFNVIWKVEVILKDRRFRLVVEKLFAARKSEGVGVCRDDLSPYMINQQLAFSVNRLCSHAYA
jgi:hypothetical protein